MNTRMDRNRFYIGTYCLRAYARTEKHIRELAECGIDFLVAVERDEKLLELLDRYHIGAVVNGVVPGWFGGEGENAGKMAERNPLRDYEAAAKDFQDHPAIWGIDVGDEPSCLDFAHYGQVIAAVGKLFPNQFPYLNLYAGYGMVASAGPQQAALELGTDDYARYLRSYCQQVESDYLCFDHYVFSSCYGRLLEDLSTAAAAAREYGRDLWMVLQVNSLDPEVFLSLDQLYLQSYTAMAFGVRCINWACYTAGWWHNHVLDKNGEKTEQYGKLKQVNSCIKVLAESYMRFRCTDTVRLVSDGPEILWGQFRQLRGAAVLAGLLRGTADGEEKAIFLAAGPDREGELRFRTEGTVLFRTGETDLRLVPDGEGLCTLKIPPCRGGLLTWK